MVCLSEDRIPAPQGPRDHTGTCAFNTHERAPTTCHLCSWHLRYPSKRRGMIFTLTGEALLIQVCIPVNHTVTGRVWKEGKESRAMWGGPRGRHGGLRVRWHLARMQSDHRQSHKPRGNRHQRTLGAVGRTSLDSVKWELLSYVAEKAMAPHSSTLAWKIPWTEEPGSLPSMGLLGVGHD